MQFSNLYKSPKSPLSRLRHQTGQQPLQPPASDWDPDLFSRDKEKQKNAVRRYLDDKVRTDWEFQWPQARKPTPSVPAVAAEEVITAPVNAGAGGPEIAEKGQEDDSGSKSGLADAQWEEPTKDTGALAQDACAGSTVHAAEHIPTPKTTTIVSSVDPTSQPSADVPADVSDGGPRDLGYEADSGSDVESEYSTVSEDPVRFKRRIEWESGEETDDDEFNYASLPLRVKSPYRFDSPDSIGADLFTRTLEAKAKKRRALRKEMKWNDGLACFQARRDAWTGAKTVRLKPTVPPETSRDGKPLSPLSPKRLFMMAGLGSPSSPAAGAGPVVPLSLAAGSPSSGDSAEGEAAFSMRETNSKDTNASSTDENEAAAAAAAMAADEEAKKADRRRYPVVTLLPNPSPLLPPGNPMRASITPSTYNSIFEKIVLQGMTPSCPVNLQDMVNACVSGWKRRGEWPPRMTAPEPNFARRKAAMKATGKQGQAMGGLKIVQAGPRSTNTRLAEKEAPAARDGNASRRKSAVALPADAPKSAAILSPSTNTAPGVTPPPPPSKTESRRKSFSFLTRERSRDERKDDDASGSSKAFRRSLQRVLGWHPHHVRGGSFDGPTSPPPMAMSGRTDPAPAVVNPEHAQARLSQDGRGSGKGSLDRRLSDEARNCGSQNASAEKIEPTPTAAVRGC